MLASSFYLNMGKQFEEACLSKFPLNETEII